MSRLFEFPMLFSQADIDILYAVSGLVFLINALYFLSLFRLLRQIRTHEEELWVSLGSPTMFGAMHINIFKALISVVSLIRFSSWLIKGNVDEALSETKVILKQTRLLLIAGTLGSVGSFAAFYMLGSV